MGSPPKLKWEAVESVCPPLNAIKMVYRAKVPGGWLVVSTGLIGAAGHFLPDPQHEWEQAVWDKSI